MCGRYASSRSTYDLLLAFDAEPADVEEPSLPPSWNVAPTDPVPVVLQREDRRLLKVARWGLVPSWAKDRKVGARMINARRETVTEKPAFRAAYQRRRCLVPADGYYEWQVVPDGGGTRKQPYYLSPADGGVLVMAGLYEVWRDPAQGELLWTCTVITTDAPDELGQIHDRTPMLVPAQHWERWLDPALADPGDDLLVPGTPGVLDAWPVGPEVGNVRSEGPQLVLPV